MTKFAKLSIISNAMAEDINKELEKCKNEREEYLNGWKRAKADLINYQKEEAKRFEEMVKFANAGMIRELIAVLDSFDLAANSLESKGVLMIRAQLEDIMRKHGLEMAGAGVGEQFNPSLHESIGETESQHPAGTIAEEITKGYLLNGRVIRPARVKLSKGQKNI